MKFDIVGGDIVGGDIVCRWAAKEHTLVCYLHLALATDQRDHRSIQDFQVINTPKNLKSSLLIMSKISSQVGKLRDCFKSGQVRTQNLKKH